MQNDSSRKSTPPSAETLDAVSSLSIEVRKVVEGIQGGQHASLHLGASVEFSEHNKYCPGDDIRHIDWRAFARTDKYFVKAHEKEVVLSCLMLLDTSPSMSYKGTRAKLTKLQYAKVLVGAMGHILVRQGDAAGLLGFSATPGDYLPPERRPEHLSTFMRKLASLECAESGTTGFGEVFQQAAGKLGQRGMVVIATDLWGATNRTEVVLSSLSARGHDVILFHVLCPDELDFPFERGAVFEGLEGEGGVFVEPSMVRQDYREAMEAQLSRWKEVAGKAGIDIITAHTGRSPASVLGEFAAKRHRVRRSR